MNLPKVSIIILNYNGLHYTLQCLASLKEITYPNYEVFVVDNNSQNQEAQVIKEKFGNYANVVENKENLGFAKANNEIIKQLLEKKVDYVFLLNNDTIIIEKDFLEKMINFIESHPDIGVLGPKLLNSNGNLQKSWTMSSTLFSYLCSLIGLNKLFYTKRYNFNAPIDVESVCGAAMLIRSKSINEVGLFDENFFFYSEDHDWCYRAKKIGWRVVYFPNTSIIHIGEVSSGGLKSLNSLYEAQLNFFSKYHSQFSYFILRFFMIFSAIIRTIIGLIIYISSFGRNSYFKKYFQSFYKLAIHLFYYK